jgi:periplasmic divalent cation tolerance protein
MYQIVLCTCPNQDIAKQIATELVMDKLAACVNIIPGITSIYSWQGEVMSDDEVQLLIKTQNCFFSALKLKIKTLHPYDIPEIVAIDIQQGDKHYLNWIKGSLK